MTSYHTSVRDHADDCSGEIVISFKSQRGALPRRRMSVWPCLCLRGRVPCRSLLPQCAGGLAPLEARGEARRAPADQVVLLRGGGRRRRASARGRRLRPHRGGPHRVLARHRNNNNYYYYYNNNRNNNNNSGSFGNGGGSNFGFRGGGRSSEAGGAADVVRDPRGVPAAGAGRGRDRRDPALQHLFARRPFARGPRTKQHK